MLVSLKNKVCVYVYIYFCIALKGYFYMLLCVYCIFKVLVMVFSIVCCRRLFL